MIRREVALGEHHSLATQATIEFQIDEERTLGHYNGEISIQISA